GVIDPACYVFGVAIGIVFLGHPDLSAGLPIGVAHDLVVIHGGSEAAELGLFLVVLVLPAPSSITTILHVVGIGARKPGNPPGNQRFLCLIESVRLRGRI